MLELLRQVPGAGTIYFIADQNERPDTEGLPVSVARVAVGAWNRDLSPWPAPGLGRGGDFAGGADGFLRAMAENIPAFEKERGLETGPRAVAGYSLAGLVALYALTKTEVFQMAASCSGSLWFDGWAEYLERAGFAAEPSYVYLSLGEREERARDPRMAAVGGATRRTHALLQHRGIKTDLVWHPGGHFHEPEKRIRAALEALAGEMA